MDWPVYGAATGGLITVYPVKRLDVAPPSLRERWAPGGIFVAKPQELAVRVYDAVRDAAELLFAATTVDPDAVAQVEGFVETWGLPGAARPLATEEGRLVADSVAAVQEVLREIGALARWLAAMQAGHWRDRAVLPERRPDFPLPERRPESWWHFKERLNRALDTVAIRPQLGFSDDPWFPPLSSSTEVFPVLSVLTPRDALFLELWRQTGHPATALRTCKGCDGVFPVSKTNREQEYHSRKCQSAAAYRRWSRKAANRRRRNRKRREARDRATPERTSMARSGGP